MSTPTGILTASSSAGGAVRIDLDLRVHRFLRDHLVGGRALLSTVMGIETIACAVQHARPERRIAAVTDIAVGPPYLVPSEGVGVVDVTLSGAEVTSSGAEVTASGGEVTSGDVTLRCQVRSDADEPHFTAVVVLKPAATVTSETAAVAPPPGLMPADLPPVRVPGDLVYGLYFHGPSFRVIGSAGVDGATAFAQLARGLPSIVEPSRRSITAPLLVELCLQTAGLWDLVAGQGMTIPRSIERVRRFSDVDSDAPGALFAVVEAGTDDLGRRFDARVIDDQGRLHLAVDAYRTTAFGHPYDTGAAARICNQLT